MTTRTKLHAGLSLIVVLLLAACGGGGGGGGGSGGSGNLTAAVADITGTWSVTESITGSCPTNPESESYTGTAEHSGNSATFHKPAIPASSSAAVDFSFTVSGDGVTLATSRSYSKRGGTVTVSQVDLTISNQGNTVSGSTAWSWSDGDPLHNCSGTSTFTATRTTGTGTRPTAPSNTLASTISSSSIDVSWMDTSTIESSFVLERSMSSASGYAALPVVVPAAANSGSAVHYTDSGLAAGTTYYYRVKARNIYGDSTYSPVANATTSGSGGGGTAPAAPTNPVISGITNTSAVLSWTANSNNETGFEVGTCTGLVSTGSNGLLICLGTFNVVATRAAGVTSHTITGLTAGTSYSYFVRAVNASGPSGNVGRSFTTTSGTQTVTLSAQYENIVKVNNLDPAVANTVYRDSGIIIGCDSYYAVTGFPNYICSAGLLAFNVSSLAGRTIDSASLAVTVAVAGVGYYPRSWRVDARQTAWSTNTVTWNNVPGNIYSVLATLNAPTYVGQTYSIDVTTAVRNWVSGTWVNNGFLLESSNYLNLVNSSSLDRFAFYGRLHASAPPRLVITYR